MYKLSFARSKSRYANLETVVDAPDLLTARDEQQRPRTLLPTVTDVFLLQMTSFPILGSLAIKSSVVELSLRASNTRLPGS